MKTSHNHHDSAVAWASHVGRVRASNEDSVAVFEEEGLFVLADGLGGHEGGEVASQVAVNSIASNVQSGGKLADAIVQANRDVVAAGHHSSARNMGTTVVAVQVKGRAFEVAWVGDSRAYRFNNGPKRLTSDHSVVGELVNSGEIGEAEAREHPMRSMLTRALGGAELDASGVGTASGCLKPGDYLLLCSDGLHGVLEDREMHGLIQSAGSVQAAVDALLQAALDRGGPDNISLVLLSPQASGA